MSTKEFAFIIIISMAFGGVIGFIIGLASERVTKQPTVKCTDSKLYDVSYEGNITIYDKRPFTTCEER